MQYGQIVFILFILMMCYYAALIVMDIRKEKAARAAEHDLHSEEDIDITDEAQSFQPVQVSRDETPKEPKGNEVGNSEGEGDEPEQETPTDFSVNTEYPNHLPGSHYDRWYLGRGNYP